MRISKKSELVAGMKKKGPPGFNSEKPDESEKLKALKKRLAVGAGQADQGSFVNQSVNDIITEARNA